MTKNVFIKSVLRQPVRHLVLALLIAAAAFSFTLRATEFVVVDSEIERLGEFYHAIGHVYYTDWASFVIDPTNTWRYTWHLNYVDFRDSTWRDFIAASPYVDIIDNRRVIAGEVEGFVHTDVVQSSLNFYEALGRVYVNDAYFFGTLTAINRFDNPVIIHGQEHVFLLFHVDEVIIGFPEVIEAGEYVRFVMPRNVVYNALLLGDGLEIGRQYLLRGMYETTALIIGRDFAEMVADFRPTSTHPTRLREPWRMGDPLNPFSLFALPIISGGDLYFLQTNDPTLDDTMHNIQGQIDLLYRNMRTMRVFPTYDMMYIPIFETHVEGIMYFRRIRIDEGRAITRRDSIDANPVTVINVMLAETRGIAIGDTITMTLREYAPIALPNPDVTADEWASWFEFVFYTTDIFHMGWRSGGADFTIPANHAEWRDFRTVELELEVVGIFRTTGQGGQGNHLNGYSMVGTYIYIPAGLVPQGFARLDHWIVFDTLYSFALHSARYMDAFIKANQATLAEMGYTLHFVYRAGAQAFFDAADTITTALTFNVTIFAVVSALVLLLAVFIYMLLTRRNFTITRMLGGKKGKAIVGVIAPAVLFWTPFIAAGAIAAWFLALSTAGNILYDLPRTTEYIVTPDMTWMLLFIGVTLAAVLLLVGISAVILSRRPILQLMQAKAK